MRGYSRPASTIQAAELLPYNFLPQGATVSSAGNDSSHGGELQFPRQGTANA